MTRFTTRLFPPVNQDNSTLTLRPILISGLARPVVDADGGIGHSVVYGSSFGLLCAIDPYNMMSTNDSIDIYWGAGNKIATRRVSASEVDTRLFLYLPEDKIVPGLIDDVYYTLNRVNPTTPPEDSIPLTLLVKLDLPGGPDGDPHLPGHSKLKKPGLPQDVIDNGVSAEWASRGVPVVIENYPGRFRRDTVQLKWGTVFLRRPITPEEAAGTAPVTVLVDQQTILSAGDTNQLLVEYQVFDEVWNFSEDWSKNTKVAVEAGGWRLDAPIIKNVNAAGIIDFEQLGTADVIVQIVVRASDFGPGDSVIMSWLGTSMNGAIVPHEERFDGFNIPSVIDARVPNAKIKDIIKGSAVASYMVMRGNGDPPVSSKRAFAKVIGETNPLAAPFILEVVGDTLEPSNNWATVQIPASQLIKAGDTLDVIWLGTTASGNPYVHEIQHSVTSNEAGKVLTLYVEPEHFTGLANGKLDLSYTAFNDDRVQTFGTSKSDHLLINVGELRQELPAPKVEQAPDDVLEPEWVPNGADVRINYLGTEPGDVVTYFWTSFSPEGTVSDWIPITIGSAGKPVGFHVPYSYIEASRDVGAKVRYNVLQASNGLYRYSATLHLRVESDKAPIIASVQDSNGTDIVNGGTTRDTHLRVFGTGRARFKVEVFDGANSLGEAAVDPSGKWSLEPGTLSVSSHSFTAKGLYGEQLISLPWTLTIEEPVFPAITSLRDSNNLEIPNGGATTQSQLRLAGTALAGATVEIFDGIKSLGQALVSSAGEWVYTLSGLTLAVHNITAKGLYDNQPTSAVWSFTVTDEVVPQISSVRDSSGAAIANGGSTSDTSVTVSGRAEASKSVEIYDGNTAKGKVNVNAAGIWTYTLNGLASTAHSLTAKALYGNALSSAPWTFTVTVQIVPLISSVKDSGGTEIPNGGTTTSTSFTAAGTAMPSEKVEIFDGATTKGVANVDSNANWIYSLPGLATGSHSITAKALYGSGLTSAARVFTISVATPPLVIDNGDARLSGHIYIFPQGQVQSQHGSGNSLTRTPSSGVPPYTYYSSNTDVAKVDSSSGYVRAFGNGQSNITVQDRAGQRQTYRVIVSGVTQILYAGSGSQPSLTRFAQSKGGWLPSRGDMSRIYQTFGGSGFPFGGPLWTSDEAFFFPKKYWAYNLLNGSTFAYLDFISWDALYLKK